MGFITKARMRKACDQAIYKATGKQYYLWMEEKAGAQYAALWFYGEDLLLTQIMDMRKDPVAIEIGRGKFEYIDTEA